MGSGGLSPPPAVDRQPNPAVPPNTTSVVEPPTDTSLSTQGGHLLRINVGPAEDGVITIAVAGELDLATAPLLGATFHRLNSAQRLHVHLDLSGVSFCDAAGLNAFLAADRLLRASSGRLTLIRPSPQIRRLLTITKLEQILAID
jgi:anti-sigma B factor antagonist